MDFSKIKNFGIKKDSKSKVVFLFKNHAKPNKIEDLINDMYQNQLKDQTNYLTNKPSILMSENLRDEMNGKIENEITLCDLQNSISPKFGAILREPDLILAKFFLEEILNKGIRLIFIDSELEKIEEINEANLQPIITDANTFKKIVNGKEMIYGNMDSCILIKEIGIT